MKINIPAKYLCKVKSKKILLVFFFHSKDKTVLNDAPDHFNSVFVGNFLYFSLVYSPLFLDEEIIECVNVIFNRLD